MAIPIPNLGQIAKTVGNVALNALPGGNVLSNAYRLINPPAKPAVGMQFPLSPGLTIKPGGFVGPQIPKATADYGSLTNRGGTIFNDSTNTGYGKPEELAAALGIPTSQIQWSKIKMAPAQATGAPSTNMPTTPQYQSTGDNLRVTSSGAVVNGNTGGVVQPEGSISPTVPDTIYDSPEYTSALKSFLATQQLSPEEEDNQKAIDAITSGLGITKANQSAQPIAMDFITGQQAASEKRALALSTPLTQKAALLQAKRQGAIEASKFALDSTEKKLTAQLKAKTDAAAAEADANKPVMVSPGGTLVNPRTGKPIFTAPEKLAADQDPGRILSATEALALGVPFGTSAGEAYGKMPTKPLTEAQSKDLTYASRGEQANTTIDELENTVSGYNSAKWLAYISAENTTLGNKFVPDEIKQIRQAERNFATAILRRESGAAISASEFATVEKQYFPRPGDDTKTLQQKAQNRQTAIDSFKQAAGNSVFPKGGDGDPLDQALNALGFKSGASGTPKAGMRTDRHNNPAAFTTVIAKQAGLKLGVDYTVGDAFPNNPNLRTAKLIGDPVAQTIRVIDNIGFYTQAGKPRWSYVSSLTGANNWSKLSYAQKASVVAQMYQHEGGSALKSAFKNYA